VEWIDKDTLLRGRRRRKTVVLLKMRPRQRERNAIPSESRKAAVGSVRFAIKVAFDGTQYQGFQSQKHGNTIQDQIEVRLQNMVRRPLRIFGWGRTDSGVHARGAVITVDLTQEEVRRFAITRKNDTDEDSHSELSSLAAKSLHSALKEFNCKGGGIGSISAISAVPVPSDFDPRFSSLWKRYVYYISSCEQGTRSPFVYRYAWQVNRPLDVQNMIDAAALLGGKHHFQWMSVSQEGELRDPFRVLQVVVETVDPGPFSLSTSLIKISATCDFFLYRMMRRIVGVLVSIGSGQVDREILAACLRDHDGRVNSATKGSPGAPLSTVPAGLLQTAPARGLCLDHVEYAIPI
jgi:tRNA pseudouridine38-40 synthase